MKKLILAAVSCMLLAGTANAQHKPVKKSKTTTTKTKTSTSNNAAMNPDSTGMINNADNKGRTDTALVRMPDTSTGSRMDTVSRGIADTSNRTGRTPDSWAGSTPDTTQRNAGRMGNMDTTRAMRPNNGAANRSAAGSVNANSSISTNPQPGDKEVKVKDKPNKTKVKHKKN